MLVLSRKNLESIVVLGADGLEPMLEVTVLGIKSSTVRLGFVAAGKVPIHRSEVWKRIKARGPPANLIENLAPRRGRSDPQPFIERT